MTDKGEMVEEWRSSPRRTMVHHLQQTPSRYRAQKRAECERHVTDGLRRQCLWLFGAVAGLGLLAAVLVVLTR